MWWIFEHKWELQINLWIIINSIIWCYPMWFIQYCKHVTLFRVTRLKKNIYNNNNNSQVSLFLMTKNGAQTNNSHRCLNQSVCHKTSQQRYINLQQEGNYTTTNLLMNQNYWQTLRDTGYWSNAFNYFCKTTDIFRTVMCVALHDFCNFSSIEENHFSNQYFVLFSSKTSVKGKFHTKNEE